MKTFLLTILAVHLLHAAYAQDDPVDAAPAEPLIDIVGAVGQPEAFFKDMLNAHVLAAFHYGPDYDLTYLIDGGLLTVEFFEGRAGFFRLIMYRAHRSAEALPLLLGVDTSLLKLTEKRDVIKVWKGHIRGVALEEVAAVTGPSGWHMAMIKVGGYPHQ